tara:strand:- start:2414 stop:2707 length:294 start_codon:yes stop_codon:yes gene_type:complete
MKNKTPPLWLNKYPDFINLWQDCGARVVNALICDGITTKEDVEASILRLHKIPNLGKVSFKLIINHFNLYYTNDKLERELVKSIKFLEDNGFKVTRL